MRAAAEGKAGIEAHDYCIVVVRRFDIPRINPKSMPEAHRLEGVEPGARPVLVSDVAKRDLRRFNPGHQVRKRMRESRAIRIGIEQGLQYECIPQRRFAHARLEDRALVGRIHVGIGERDRQGAEVFQCGFDAGLLRGAQGQREFEEGHIDISSFRTSPRSGRDPESSEFAFVTQGAGFRVPPAAVPE